MPINIDFHQIRTFKNSQNDAFEELCCQLANLEIHASGSTFWRKEGAGGDAGVECYWVNPDQSEEGWQVKYFFEIDWCQINDSVITALTKHPKLTRYVICLPKNLTDRRVRNQKCEKDKWDDYVSKWKNIAIEKNMRVDFDFWGEHKLISLLTIDSPEYTGKYKYWFNKTLFTQEWFKDKFTIVRDDLGERYTPELHFELPIIEYFNALSGTKEFIDKFTQLVENVNKCYIPNSIGLEYDTDDIKTKIQSLREKNTFLIEFLETVKISNNSFFDTKQLQLNLQENINSCNLIQQSINEIIFKDDKYEPYSNQYRDLSDSKHNIENYYSSLSDFEEFLISDSMKIFNDRRMLLLGEAGTGKSHLLADVTKHNIENGFPALLFLGQYYTGGNPWSSIKERYDITDYKINEFLSSLNTAAECARSRCTIFIDAINEGEKRDDWKNWIASFLNEINKYTLISVCISCRTIYARKVLGNDYSELHNCVFHYGFNGFEYDAAKHFFNHYNIDQPNAPFLSPEFSNPLFLKTICYTLSRQNIRTIPKGMHGISRIFQFYVEALDHILELKKGISYSERITENSLKGIASYFCESKTTWTTRTKMRSILRGSCDDILQPNEMLEFLLNEGALSETVQYEGDNLKRSDYVLRFTYERFSDYFIAKSLLDNHLDPINPVTSFSQTSFLYQYLNNSNIRFNTGLIEALSIQLPERCGRELIALVPEKWANSQRFQESFLESIIWRKPSASGEETLNWFNTVNVIVNKDKTEILIKTSIEPEHFFNAEFLHRNLIGKTLSELDSFWTIRVIKYFNLTGGRNAIDSLIFWARTLNEIEYEEAKLCSIVLSWLFSSSHRKIRDTATKALVNIIRVHQSISIELLEKFGKVNDQYILERILCGIYGGIVTAQINDTNLKTLSQKVFTLLFEHGNPIPNMMVRDYGRNIIEYALFTGSIHESVDIVKCRPPYKSKWPLEIPDRIKLEKMYGHDDICESTIGFVNDFGNYTMSDVHHWSITELNAKKPITSKDILKNYRTELTKKKAPENVINAFDLRYKLKGEPDLYLFVMRDIKKKSSKELDSIKSELSSTEPIIAKYYGSEELNRLQYYFSNNLMEPLYFKKGDAQSWVCQRAHELGWTKDLFEEFERHYKTSHGRSGSNMVERIGKKYQWIAYYELLAYLSDNLIHIDSWKYHGIKHFEGPWLITERNIDPTYIKEKTYSDNGYDSNNFHWWIPFKIEFPEMNNDEKKEWLWSENDIPDFKKLILLDNPKDNSEWFMLDCNGHWNENHASYHDLYWRQFWFRIQSCIIDADDLNIIKKYYKNNRETDGFELESIRPDIFHFLFEYPWHPMCKDHISDIIHKDSSGGFPVDGIRTTVEYNHESQVEDYSITENMNITLPSPWIIKQLNLFADTKDLVYRNESGSIDFYDPSVFEPGPSSALIRKSSITGVLQKNNKIIFWRIVGEKEIVPPSNSRDYWGRQLLFGLYWFDGENLNGKFDIKNEERDNN